MNPVDTKILIAEIEATGRKLGPYDSNFIKSVKARAEEGRYLTALQGGYLQTIYRRVQQSQFVNKERIG